MKKLICALLLVSLFSTSTQIVNAAETNDSISSNIIKEYNLEELEKAPDNIEPIYVDNEQELTALLDQLEKEFSKKEITTEESNSISSRATIVVDNATLTHQATIFELSSVGGKIVSDVNYTYSYWIVPESYKTTVNYHDVYETGIYAFQEITYFNKTATANGATIKVNVRGNSKVYIGISGGVHQETLS